MLLFILFALSLKANNIITTGLPNINRLPTKEILCIFQDSGGYMWYGTEEGLCRDDGYQINVFRSDFNTPQLLESNSVTSITEDKERKIWFGTKRGVYILDKRNSQIQPLTDNEIKGWVIKKISATSEGSIWVTAGGILLRYDVSGRRLGRYELKWEGSVKEVNSICEDHQGSIWMVQLKGGLFRYDTKEDRFIQYPWPYQIPATCMVKDATTPYYWIGTWGNGIVQFDPREKDIHRMFVSQPATNGYADINKKRISSITQDSVRHHLWITTTDNLYTYEIIEKDRLRKIDISDLISEDKKALTDVMCDRLGNLWITGKYPDSYSFIVSYLPHKPTSYPMDLVNTNLGVFPSPMELFCQEDFYWVRQKRIGLYVYDTRKEHLAMHRNRNRSISFFFEKSKDNNGIYVAVYESKVLLIQYNNGDFSETEICKIPNEPHERIRALYDDKHGNLWIGTTYNLFKYELKQKKLEKVYENTGIINDIISLEDGSIYIATESEGFWRIIDGRKDFKHFTKENYTVLAVSEGKVWAGTQQGNIYCYDPETNKFTSKTEECCLIGDAITDLLADDYGSIWILTDQIVTVYNPQKQIINPIRCSDPSILLDNFLSLHKGENGEIHIGGRGGVLVFPLFNQLQKPTMDLSIGLTSVKINNMLKILDGDSRNILLQPKERNIELFFSTFDPLNTNKIRYAFRQKRDSVWNYLPMGQNSIYLAELSKGEYEIEVKATDGNGQWSKSTTTILVQRLPDWFETWWAYSLYVILFLGIVFFIVQRYIWLQKSKQHKLMEERVAQMKYRFFTNVSHELRTPLTLIVTPLETIIKKLPDTNLKQQLYAINKNAQNLLGLVNQLLDFRKMEMGCEALSLVKGDIIEFISSIYDNFRLVSTEKNIDFHFHTHIKPLYLFFDVDKLHKVVNNLLSNAFKYTEEGGCISLSIDEEFREQTNYVVISVKDTGKGIPSNELSSIFERFHQVKGQSDIIGSGIGLHIVKEYVHLHNGKVDVKSELGEGSTFSVYIPTDLKPKESRVDSYIERKQEKDLVAAPLLDSGKKILIVEDNTEFRTFLKNELSQFYIVYEAVDGLEGEKEAEDKEPDIIITDLMMPGIDGIELCHRIKNNINTSHIPVILLTANCSLENETRGYKEGADAYISKPFHWEILSSRIENLLTQKISRQQIFDKELEVKPKDITISSLDEKLIQKVLNLVEANLSNSDYSIEDLSSDMCMSRANLYRKIHSITGLTPTDFVKSMRLKKAAELLKDSELTVVEVAYATGFNTPSYFTKSFKKMFGVLPTQFTRK